MDDPKSTIIVVSRDRWNDIATPGARDAVSATISWDATAHDMVESMLGLLLAMGYHVRSVIDACESYVDNYKED